MSLFSVFAENSYSVCLARALVAPLFVRILYKTAGLAGWGPIRVSSLLTEC